MTIGIGVLVYDGPNLGDWYQSAAALYVWWKYVKSPLPFKLFLEKAIQTRKIDKYDIFFLNRDNIETKPDGIDKIVLICNGWWMSTWNGVYKFPFPEFIEPVFVSFHMTSEKILTKEAITYLKKYVIGCRDKSTQALLAHHDIPCYFSGCLTMVLNLQDHNLGFEKSIDYNGAHVFNEAPLDLSDGTLIAASSQILSKYIRCDPALLITSVQKTFNHFYADKITTSRLHLWLPLLSNGKTNLVFWNLEKNRPYLVSDKDPIRSTQGIPTDRFIGLLELKDDVEKRNTLKEALFSATFNHLGQTMVDSRSF